MRRQPDPAATRARAPSPATRVLERVLRRAMRRGAISGLDPDDVARGRRRMEALTFLPPRGSVTETLRCLAGRPAGVYRTPASRTDAAVLWLHGGAYVSGSLRTHRELFASLAEATGLVVVGLDYRLAPEHAFPAWLDDAVGACATLIDELGAANVVLGGDSAGGGLALATLLANRDDGRAQPAAAIAFSPWTDLAGTLPSWRANADVDAMIDAASLSAVGRAIAVAADRPATDPLLSPAFGDFAGCPPLLLEVGTTEVLLDDARAIRDAYIRCGGAVELHEWPQAPHVFPAFARILPEGRAAHAEVSAFVARHLDRRA